MHFFYLDESGDTGEDLTSSEQPIMVLGGISVRDQGWLTTTTKVRDKLEQYLGHEAPPDFELHADELLSPEGEGAFAGHERERRNQLALDILTLLAERGHPTHYVAIDKAAVREHQCSIDVGFNTRCPYLVAFDSLVSLANQHVRQNLGNTVRGLIILDEKDQFSGEIDDIMWIRRFGGPMAHRVKWVTEAGYPVDSTKNLMIQVSDLVAFLVKKFLEMEYDYSSPPDEARSFFASCYQFIDDQRRIRTIVERSQPALSEFNDFCRQIVRGPRQRWRHRYGLDTT